jgi:hypothetical protein
MSRTDTPLCNIADDYACPKFLYKRPGTFLIEYTQSWHAHPNLMPMLDIPAPEAAPVEIELPSPFYFKDLRFKMFESSMFKSISIFKGVDDKYFEGKKIRQLVKGEVDLEGNDISGFFVLSDGGAVLLYKNYTTANIWANDLERVNKEIAPSLTYIQNTQISVSFFGVD